MVLYLKIFFFIYFLFFIFFFSTKNVKNNDLNSKTNTKENEAGKVIYDITHENNLHSIYGEKCSKCNKLIGEFNFKNLGKLKCPGYPRLYQLSDYWGNIWLLGGNEGEGKIFCRRSKDKGENWSEPIQISKYPEHTCSNVDFFELPNHNIISSYRAIGNNLNSNSEIKYNRKLCTSISYDGGITWEKYNVIIDNYELAERLGKSKDLAIKACMDENRIGFSEPFVEMISNEVTVFYADDFTTMIMKVISNDPVENFRTQNIYSQTLNLDNNLWSTERKLIMDGTIKKSPTGSGLIKRISRDGMPVVNKMKDGTYIMVFEGTYRDKDYPLLTGKYLNEHHWFEILLSYSKNGINWSNPVEIYVSKNNGTKSSAPFVLSNENNQLIISFQTDEDSYTSGFDGDIYSIMKVMVSRPGITIENINKDSFYALCNNNNSPIGGKSVWNGMMILGNILYTCSSDNIIKYSEIPIYEDPNKYNKKLRNEYEILNGNISVFGNKITSLDKQTIIINKIIDISLKKSFYSYITPIGNNDCGLVFGVNDLNISFWKENYFFLFLIKKEGYLTLSKLRNGVYYELASYKNKYFYKEFHKNNTYKMKVRINIKTGEIMCSINENDIFCINDNSLRGKKVGLISYGKRTIFTHIITEK